MANRIQIRTLPQNGLQQDRLSFLSFSRYLISARNIEVFLSNLFFDPDRQALNADPYSAKNDPNQMLF
jgi:hypothetical protein